MTQASLLLLQTLIPNKKELVFHFYYRAALVAEEYHALSY